MLLLNRTIQAGIPWKINFQISGGGMSSLKFKRAMAGVLAFSSAQNRLINGAIKLLDYLELESDDSVVIIKTVASTWAPADDEKLLRSRHSQLSRAIQSWGSISVSEICGDAFEGAVSSMLAVNQESPA